MIGTTVGNYRVVKVLGQGGMGTVYLAQHPRLGRHAAIKVLHSELGRRPEMLERFFTEAWAANAIRHPNIVETYDCGALPGGGAYIVMEHLEGVSLAARIASLGRLPLPSALDLATQVASALGAAHAKGIVHRDLKPENIFVVPDERNPAREQIKVLDFGVAKLADATKASLRTRSGVVLGTPVYMSPEQCFGTQAVDHRSDIYSLGLVLYEMICGAPPFVSEGLGELVNMHLNVAPRPPRELVPGIPAGVEQVILRALAKKPEDRFTSMTDFAEALRCEDAGPARLPAAPAPTAPAPLAATEVAPAQSAGLDTLAAAASALLPAVSRRNWLVGGSALAVIALIATGAIAVRRQGQRRATATATGTATPRIPTAAPAPVRPVDPPSAAPPGDTVVPPAPITIRVDSIPGEARVVDVATEEPLGTTPLLLERGRSGRTLALRVEKKGFAARVVHVPLSGDSTQQVELRPRRPSAAPPPAPAKPAEPARTGPIKI